MRSNTGGTLGLVVGFVVAGSAIAQPVLYLDFDAASGTLPSDQCWGFSGSTSPAPTISNGELLMGPTSASQSQLFGHTLLFDFMRDHVVCEWDLRVVSSDYGTNVCGNGQRAGWYAVISDGAGRLVYCGIGSNHVFLTNNGPAFVGVNAPVTTGDFTDAFHAFRLEVNSTGSVLFIDGVQRLTMPMGSTGVIAEGQASFGDASVCAGSQTRMHRFRVSLPPQCGVDFNRDCVADFFDYLDFVDAFSAQRPEADFNEDGVIDFFDYLDFVDLMSRDC